jgi:hypothetical protein
VGGKRRVPQVFGFKKTIRKDAKVEENRHEWRGFLSGFFCVCVRIASANEHMQSVPLGPKQWGEELKSKKSSSRRHEKRGESIGHEG